MLKKIMQGVAVAALCASVMAGTAHAAAYCTKGTDVEVYWVGEWHKWTVVEGPDRMGQCKLENSDNAASWITKERIRPVGGGTFDTAAAPAAPKPQAVAAGKQGAQSYCTKGAKVEVYWVGEWHEWTVVGGPDRMGQCKLENSDNAASWITKERIRPVGGGAFKEAAAAPAPVAAPALAVDPAPAAAAVNDNDITPEQRAAYEKLMSYDPHAPQPVGNLGALTPGVYMCEQDAVGNDTSVAFGIIDGSNYRNFDGKKGKYKYDDASGVLELVSGDSAGLKYVRTLDTTFRLLKEDGSKTGMNCNLNRAKSLGGRW